MCVTRRIWITRSGSRAQSPLISQTGTHDSEYYSSSNSNGYKSRNVLIYHENRDPIYVSRLFRTSRGVLSWQPVPTVLEYKRYRQIYQLGELWGGANLDSPRRRKLIRFPPIGCPSFFSGYYSSVVSRDQLAVDQGLPRKRQHAEQIVIRATLHPCFPGIWCTLHSIPHNSSAQALHSYNCFHRKKKPC